MPTVMRSDLDECPTSVMPKGVEHRGDRLRLATLAVPTSVMPKGVEHMRSASRLPTGRRADLCDAERR